MGLKVDVIPDSYRQCSILENVRDILDGSGTVKFGTTKKSANSGEIRKGGGGKSLCCDAITCSRLSGKDSNLKNFYGEVDRSKHMREMAYEKQHYGGRSGKTKPERKGSES